MASQKQFHRGKDVHFQNYAKGSPPFQFGVMPLNCSLGFGWSKYEVRVEGEAGPRQPWLMTGCLVLCDPASCGTSLGLSPLIPNMAPTLPPPTFTALEEKSKCNQLSGQSEHSSPPPLLQRPALSRHIVGTS